MTDVLLNTVGEMKICGIEPDMLTTKPPKPSQKTAFRAN